MNYRFDPRSKLWGVLMAILATSSYSNHFIEITTTIIFIIFLFIANEKKSAIRISVIYLLQWMGYLFVLPNINQPFIIFGLSFLVNGVRELMPAVASLNFTFRTTKMAEWVALFKLWHFPNFLLIPLTVIGRFFPTIFQDYQKIVQAMKLRGIAVSWKQWVLNPVAMFEYILIPLLMNATQVGEDLTISALTKGFSIRGPKSSLTKLNLQTLDLIFILTITVPFLIQLGGHLL